MIEIDKINGNEIIDYINSQFDDEDSLDYFNDGNICYKSFVFESQGIVNKEYFLRFSADYNNWGTNQEINDNVLRISLKSIRCSMREPFDSGVAESLIVDLISNWIHTHQFVENTEELFGNVIDNLDTEIMDLKYKKFTTEQRITNIDSIINALTKAKTYLK